MTWGFSASVRGVLGVRGVSRVRGVTGACRPGRRDNISACSRPIKGMGACPPIEPSNNSTYCFVTLASGVVGPPHAQPCSLTAHAPRMYLYVMLCTFHHDWPLQSCPRVPFETLQHDLELSDAGSDVFRLQAPPSRLACFFVCSCAAAQDWAWQGQGIARQGIPTRTPCSSYSEKYACQR